MKKVLSYLLGVIKRILLIVVYVVCAIVALIGFIIVDTDDCDIPGGVGELASKAEHYLK